MDQTWRKVRPLEQLMLESCNPSKQDVITITLTISKLLTLKDLQSTFLTRLLSHPRFSSKPSLNRRGAYRYDPVPHFTPTSDALVNHHMVFEPPVPDTEPEREQRRMFVSRLSEISSTPLDTDKPLWRIHIFSKWALVRMERATSTTLVLRVHHSLADGIGLVKYFLSKIADVNEASRLLIPTWHHRSLNGRSWHRAVRESIRDVHKVVVKPLFRDPTSVFTRAPVGEANLIALLPPRAFTVSDMKKATSRLGVTINDLLLAAFAGAVRSYVTDFGDDPEGLRGMRVAMPYNKHTFDHFEMSDVSNQLAMIPIDLPVDIADSAERLAICVDAMRRLKRGVQAGTAVQAMRTISHLPGALRKTAWARAGSSASSIFSNVAGPCESVSIGGARVSAIYFSPPCDVHNAVNIGIFSYDDGFYVSVAGDAERLKQPQRLADYFLQEISSIVEISEKSGGKHLIAHGRRSSMRGRLPRMAR